jgi:hypothetical protein
MSTKKFWATLWAIFFTDSSGHLAPNPADRSWRDKRLPLNISFDISFVAFFYYEKCQLLRGKYMAASSAGDDTLSWEGPLNINFLYLSIFHFFIAKFCREK